GQGWRRGNDASPQDGNQGQQPHADAGPQQRSARRPDYRLDRRPRGEKEGSLMSDWPTLHFAEWEKTCDTLHMWTQIVGKTRMALPPLENHWWNVMLSVTPRGLGTSSIPWNNGSFSMEFDLVAHQLLFHGT